MPTARILVIDDDRLIRQMVRNLPEGSGFTVEEAVDGADGLTQAAAVRPDLILLNLMMPGMDGYTACSRLKAEPATQAVPVIVLTASSNLSLNRCAYAAGAVACVTKPFRREALLAVVYTSLQGLAHGGARNGAEAGMGYSGGPGTSP